MVRKKFAFFTPEIDFNQNFFFFGYLLGLLRLTVNNVTPSDVGKYTCRIYNPHGEDVCHAELVYDSKF